MEKLRARLKGVRTEESRRIGLSFLPEAGDVFITTFPKCGTTWVSMMLHCLRSRGNLDFGEITEVVPWTVCAHDCKQDLNDPQKFSPRLFKSHEDYETVPKGGKYVYVVRNPAEVVVSYYEFLTSLAQVSQSELSFEDFFHNFFLSERRIWDHYLSFIEQRENPNILWVFYEDLLQDRGRCIEEIAAFASIPLDDELKNIVMEQTSFEFMKTHATKFDDHFLFSYAYPRINALLPEGEKLDMNNARANKVHKGGGRVRIALSDSVLSTMESEWNKIIGTRTGIGSYSELRTQLSFLLRE